MSESRDISIWKSIRSLARRENWYNNTNLNESSLYP